MESLMMASRVVVPMAIMVGIGMLLRIFKVTDAPTMKKMDTMVFKLFMPMLMFYNIYNTDFSQLDNIGYILYGVAGLLIIFLAGLFIVPKYVKPMPTASAYSQAIMRSNYLIFGVAVAESIYGAGNIGLFSLMAAVAVPAFNVLSAILLEAGRHGMADVKKLLLAIVKNPTVIASTIGLVINLSGITIPDLFLNVVRDISRMTTPMSFLSIGVTLSFGAMSKKGYLASAIGLRLVLIPLIFVTGAALLGFRGQELCALTILFAAPTAVSSYSMAVAMGADGEFAGQMVALTTVLCLPTIFLWTLVLNMMHLI